MLPPASIRLPQDVDPLGAQFLEELERPHIVGTVVDDHELERLLLLQ